jgi:predicted RNA-binding protein (virulence factor B family)
MAEIGKTNTVRVVKRVDFGVYLDCEELGEILLPNRYVPIGCRPDDMLDVFLYFDSEDRIIATTEIPNAEVGKCSHLQVVSTSHYGVFLNWGLSKDLLVPFKEQQKPMREGRSYTVFLYIDASGRIAASSKLSSFLKEEDAGSIFIEGQIVRLQIASQSDMGFKAVIDDTHLGLIHKSDILQPIHVGDEMYGYIKNIRQDGRIDLTLQAHGDEAMDSLSKGIIEFILTEGGTTDITDKSSPSIIYEAFGVSKSTYKKALGRLYKEKRIMLEKDLITLL